VSEKIHRNPAKGGAPNALFVHATVEKLPSELDGVASEVQINFPWGSLLKAVAAGDVAVLSGLRRICSAGASLKVVIGLDPERDRSEIVRLGLEGLSKGYLETRLVPQYRAAGFDVLETTLFSPAEWPEVVSSWGKRLSRNLKRQLVGILARAADEKPVQDAPESAGDQFAQCLNFVEEGTQQN
jgi:16S rRNA (adenine(1408)-N(1))-methyltransferase